MELARNARYYQTSYANETTPGTATTANIAGGVPITNGVLGTITAIPFPTRMRATPTTISYWDGAGTANATSYTLNAGFTFTNGATWSIVQTFGPSAHGFYLGYFSGTPATASYFVHYAAYADFW